MPTLPAREPHQQRQVAESFGTDADRYDRARPGYPDDLVRAIVAASPGPDVLDVGCGTGIAARQLQAAGCRVLGIDVDARMADLARRRGLDVEVAKFEEWDAGGRTFDAVVAGQAWHWVDPVAGAAAAARVLRPGGLLAVFWNVFQPPPDLAAAIGAVYRRVVPETPFPSGTTSLLAAYLGMCAKTADGITDTAAFAEPLRWRYDWQRSYTRDEWLDQVPTFGGHSRLPQSTQDELLAGIGAAVDAAGGSFVVDYATVAVAATRHRSTGVT